MASGCSGSVSGHDGGDRNGLCTWCGRKVNRKVPAPDRTSGPTELGEAYRRAYDPDWGSGRYDVDP